MSLWIKIRSWFTRMWNRNVRCRVGEHEMISYIGTVDRLDTGENMDTYSGKFCLWCLKKEPWD